MSDFNCPSFVYTICARDEGDNYNLTEDPVMEGVPMQEFNSYIKVPGKIYAMSDFPRTTKSGSQVCSVPDLINAVPCFFGLEEQHIKNNKTLPAQFQFGFMQVPRDSNGKVRHSENQKYSIDITTNPVWIKTHTKTESNAVTRNICVDKSAVHSCGVADYFDLCYYVTKKMDDGQSRNILRHVRIAFGCFLQNSNGNISKEDHDKLIDAVTIRDNSYINSVANAQARSYQR